MIEKLKAEKLKGANIEKSTFSNLKYIANNATKAAESLIAIRNKGYLSDEDLDQLRNLSYTTASAIMNLEALYQRVIMNGSEKEDVL